MKFGSQLELYAIPEWQDKYIRYNYLKRFLSRRQAQLKGTGSVRAIRSVATSVSPLEELVVDSTVEIPPTTYDKELVHVSNHFNEELGFLKDRLDGVQEELARLNEEEELEEQKYSEDAEPSTAVGHASSSSSQDSERGDARSQSKHFILSDVDSCKERKLQVKTRASHRERLARAVLAIWDTADKLEGFVQLNTVALYKILKKRDKVLQLRKLNADLAEKKRVLSLLSIPHSFKDLLTSVYREATAAENGEVVEDIENMAALVQKHFVSTQVSHMGTEWISFFLGACTVAALDLIVAATLRPTNPNYSLGSVLLMLPVFRLCLMTPLIFWGAGAAIFCFEVYGVNYRFLLNIDPKCRVSSRTLFYIAELLTAFWIIGFGSFLVDVKFGLVLDPEWYWTYCTALIVCHICVLIVPSRTFRMSYRKNIFLAFYDTIKSGIWPGRKVTLIDNILGDILTSLPKPLLDLKYVTVFYGGLYFLDAHASYAALPPLLEDILLPLITLLPYWLRFIQCFTRWRLEPDRRGLHVGNMGKYFSTIVVILTSNVPWENLGLSIYASRLIFVFTYIFASLYNLIWDVMFDWGLMPDPDNFMRPDHRILYPQWIYYFITVFNVIARLTWALTLIPIGVIEDYRLNVALIIYIISALEIFRRSAWMVLRLENEHLTNSSRYRAMLWVPKLTSSQERQSSDFFLAPSAKNMALRKGTTLAHAALVKREAINILPHIEETLAEPVNASREQKTTDDTGQNSL